jgi:hypothetical protein
MDFEIKMKCPKCNYSGEKIIVDRIASVHYEWNAEDKIYYVSESYFDEENIGNVYCGNCSALIEEKQ